MTEQHFPILELSDHSAEKDIWEITSVHTIDPGTFCRNVLPNHPGNQPKCKSQFCKKKKKIIKKSEWKGRWFSNKRENQPMKPSSLQWHLECVRGKEKNGVFCTEVFGRGR